MEVVYEKVLGPKELELQTIVCCQTWVLECELGFSVRTLCVLFYFIFLYVLLTPESSLQLIVKTLAILEWHLLDHSSVIEHPC